MGGPRVIIVGAAKAGTTSLYRYLLGHPQVFLPREMKEINYFSGASDAVRTQQAYLRLFDGAQASQVCMDISTSYLYDADSAAKIAELIGKDVKIIAMLRNPVNAAYSLWNQLRHFGDETGSFEDGLAREKRRRQDPARRPELRGWPANYYYTDRYTYAPQLERYLARFSKNNIAVYIFEEFFGNLQASWQQLCVFSGIDPAHQPANLGSIHNPSGQGIRSTLLHRALYENLWWKKAFVWAIPEHLKTRLRLSLDDLNKSRGSAAGSGLSEATRIGLQAHFSNDVRTLEKLLGRSLADVWF
jgi:hypothetical protein